MICYIENLACCDMARIHALKTMCESKLELDHYRAHDIYLIGSTSGAKVLKSNRLYSFKAKTSKLSNQSVCIILRAYFYSFQYFFFNRIKKIINQLAWFLRSSPFVSLLLSNQSIWRNFTAILCHFLLDFQWVFGHMKMVFEWRASCEINITNWNVAQLLTTYTIMIMTQRNTNHTIVSNAKQVNISDTIL